ncbi:MAG: MFS transporter [Eubacteriales bacterium]|nr:MFS transporter [Eubacteriales bacterium]
MKLDYKKTFLIGFGFFASSLAWSIYNSFVPLMLEERFLASTAIIGFIMTIDNIFGVIFQPLFGQLSDRTRTRFGRRMPYIMLGIPTCAAAFIFIPRMPTLFAMMAVIIAFNLIMSFWRSPVVALMPDLTPSPLRSKANGIINLMGGVGSIIAFFVGGLLAKAGGYNAPFLMGAAVMLAALIILFTFIKEPDSRKLGRQLDTANQMLSRDDTAQTGTKADLSVHRHLSRPEKVSLFALLLAIFFWFCGYNAVETFFTLYATQTLGISGGDAAMTLTLFSLALVAFALPAGILAGRFGRRRMILIGLVGMIIAFIPMLFIENLWILRLLLFLGGLCWACININSLPMVVELASHDRIGSYTGYYYFFSFSAAIVSPTLFGLLRDLTDQYSILFPYSIAAFALAFICMLMVHHGEAEAEPLPEQSTVS